MKTTTRDAEQMNDLRNFAAAALAAAACAPEAFRFGRNKVFIAALDLPRAVHDRLVEAHRAGLMRLCRADLVIAMDPKMVEASEVRYLNAEFHLVDLEAA